MLELISENDTPLRKAKDLMDGDFALCLAYLEIEKFYNNSTLHFSEYYIEGYMNGLEISMEAIKDMLDVATLGNIDWEDIKKAPMRR
jgi:hypothetical protein